MKKAIKWGCQGSAPLLGAALALTLGTIGGCNKSDAPGGTTGGTGSVSGGTAAEGTVATVNGEAIDREALRSAAEATAGEEALRQMIDYQLLMQKMASEKLEVTDAEVDEFLEARRKENPELLAKVMENKGPQLDELKRRIRSQLAVDKLLTKNIKVTDAQLKTWFEKHRAPYDQPEKVKIGILFTSTKTRADIMAKQLKSKTKSFKELVAEQKKANDASAKQSFEEIPQAAPVSSLDAKTAALIKPLKSGDITPVTNFGSGAQSVYAVIRLVERQPAKKANFEELKSELEMQYKLEQVARNEAKADPQTGNFDKMYAETKKMLESSGQGAVSERQVLNTLNRAAVQRLITSARTGAKVEIPDKTYAHLAEAYKPMAGMPPGMMSPGGAPGGAPPAGAPGSAPPAGAPPAPPQ